MSSYVEEVLVPGEQVLHLGRISLWSLWSLLLGGFLLLPMFGVGLIFWIMAWVRYRSTELAVTNKRVIAKFGFIRRSTIELQIGKIESVQVDQGILGRIFNFGTLIIAGGGTAQAPIPGISDPLAFRRAFVQAQEAPRLAPGTPPRGIYGS